MDPSVARTPARAPQHQALSMTAGKKVKNGNRAPHNGSSAMRMSAATRTARSGMPCCFRALTRMTDMTRDNVAWIVRAISRARHPQRIFLHSLVELLQPVQQPAAHAPEVTTGMMATIHAGTAIILLVAGSQHACSVDPVATGWPASLTISYENLKLARLRSLIQHRTSSRSFSRAGRTYRTVASTTGKCTF